MTFTPIHLELLVHANRGMVFSPIYNGHIMQLAELHLVEEGSFGSTRLTAKGQALLSFLCTAADGGFHRPLANLTEEAINHPTQEVTLLREIRDAVRELAIRPR